MPDNSASAQHDPLPYEVTTDDTYPQRAAESFAVDEPSPGILILRGPCPRCAAVIDVPIVQSVFRGWFPSGGRRNRMPRATEPGRVEPMMCTCEDEHPQRPEGTSGCGAFWTLTISASDQ
jgi:hypothetical protein